MALKAVEPLDKSYHRQRHLIVNGTSLVDCQPRIPVAVQGKADQRKKTGGWLLAFWQVGENKTVKNLKMGLILMDRIHFYFAYNGIFLEYYTILQREKFVAKQLILFIY